MLLLVILACGSIGFGYVALKPESRAEKWSNLAGWYSPILAAAFIVILLSLLTVL